MISGYLITGILLEGRDHRLTAGAPPLWHFFARRTLRLWPAYYALLAIMLWANTAEIRDTALWHLTYTTNILLYVRDNWDPWITNHFWSLDIEEQFYLLWPLLIMHCNRRALPWAVLASVLGSFVFQLVADPMGWNGQEVGVDSLLPASFLMLGAGGLLAILERDNKPWLRHIVKAGYASLIIWVVAFALGYERNIWLLLFEACIWAALVYGCVCGVGGLPGAVLSFAPLRYCGKISYCIYLVHPFVGNEMLEWHDGAMVNALGLRLLLLTTVASIAIATASWYLFEGPINRLKRHFPYPRMDQRKPIDRNPIYQPEAQPAGSSPPLT